MGYASFRSRRLSCLYTAQAAVEDQYLQLPDEAEDTNLLYSFLTTSVLTEVADLAPFFTATVADLTIATTSYPFPG